MEGELEGQLQFQLAALDHVLAGGELLKFMARKPNKPPHAKTIKLDAAEISWGNSASKKALFGGARLGVSNVVQRAQTNLTEREISCCFTVNCPRKGEICFQARTPLEACKWATGIVLLAAGVNQDMLYKRKTAARIAGLPTWAEGDVGPESPAGKKAAKKQRRLGISSEGTEETAQKDSKVRRTKSGSIDFPAIPKDEKTMDILINALKQNFLFNGLSEKELAKMALTMERVSVSAKKTIIVQDDTDTRFYYVIASGTVTYFIAYKGGASRDVGTATSGDSFGDLALMYDAPRAATVVAKTDCVLYRLDRVVFETCVIDRSIGSSVAQFIMGHPIFDGVSTLGVTEISSHFVSEYVDQGETLWREGDDPDGFYFIVDGKVRVKLPADDVARRRRTFEMGDSIVLESQEFFGERSLIVGGKRTSTVIAETRVTLLRMSVENFMRYLPMFSDNMNDFVIYHSLRGNSDSIEVTREQVAGIVDSFEFKTFDKGQKLCVSAKAPEDLVYVIRKGTITVGSTGQSQGPFTVFAAPLRGVKDEVTNAVVTSANLEVFVIKREKYLAVAEPGRRGKTLRLLKSVPLLNQLKPEEFETLSQCMVEEKFALGDYIIREGDIGSTFYIVIEGRIKITKSNPKKPNDPPSVIPADNTGAGFFFGERALLTNEPRAVNIVADWPGETICFVLSRDDFEKHLGDLREILEAHYRQLEAKKAENTITFEDLNVLCTLGTGQFGRVKLVEYKRIKKTYAMKCIGKQALSKSKTEIGHLQNEVNVMKVCDSPFLLRLVKTLIDSHSFYMILELCQGGELFSVLTAAENGRIPESHALFYGSCVLMGLEHLHQHGIVYRDLKPENLMLDEYGYIRIVDFGFAKFVKGKTYTLCGTPDYLAPEIITRKGHNRAVDVWAFGVLLYELVAGKSPFSVPNPSHGSQMYENILALKYSCPKLFSKDLTDLVKKILVVKVESRLGMGKTGWNSIKQHKFFNTVNFERLQKKALPAPFRPTIGDAKDTSNFDAYDEADDPPPFELPALDDLV